MENVGIRDERAQIILIGAFLIAIGVISALLIVNDIGFSQTIATQDGGEEGFESLEFEAGVEQAVSEAMEGNGTTPQNASVEFEEYLRGYSDETNEAVQAGGIRSNVEPDTSNLTTAWMVGQRSNGTFVNARGDKEWIMVEDIPSPSDDNIRGKFELNVSDMRGSGPSLDPFLLNGTEEGDFTSLTTLTDSKSWSLKMKINDSTGSPSLNLNMTTRENLTVSPGLELGNFDQRNTNVAGNDTVTVDVFNETVNGDSSGFPSTTYASDGSAVNPEDANGFKFDRGSKGNGTYEFRFDSDVTESRLNSSSTGDPKGPCTHPDGPPCRSADGTEKHIVGVVHNVTGTVADIEYVSRSTSYENTIGTAGGMTLDAEDVNLDEIENVDGAASFNVEILKTNSPEPEDHTSSGGIIEIKYSVENTGTEDGTQDVNLTIPAANTDSTNIGNNESVTVQDGNTIESTDVGFDNVTWEPDAGKNGTYTAFVRSVNTTTGEKTVDTTVISVDKWDGSSSSPGIPDSPVGFAFPLPSWDAMAEAAAVAEGVSR